MKVVSVITSCVYGRVEDEAFEKVATSMSRSLFLWFLILGFSHCLDVERPIIGGFFVHFLKHSTLFFFCTLSFFAAGCVQPIEKNGSCPTRYSPSGGYCTPQQGATHAIDKTGSCPSGYRPSGNYCLANSDSSNLAIHKVGSCPTGFRPSGDYCLSNKWGIAAARRKTVG